MILRQYLYCRPSVCLWSIRATTAERRNILPQLLSICPWIKAFLQPQLPVQPAFPSSLLNKVDPLGGIENCLPSQALSIQFNRTNCSLVNCWMRADSRENYLFPSCVLSSISCVWLFATLWTVACQAPVSMGFFRQECWSGLPCLLWDL